MRLGHLLAIVAPQETKQDEEGMRRIHDIAVLILIVLAIGINVALPPDLDFCNGHEAAVSPTSTDYSSISILPQASFLHRNAGNHCRVQLPFSNALLVANFAVGGFPVPVGHVPRGKGRTMNDHPPTPLIGPPKYLS